MTDRIWDVTRNLAAGRQELANSEDLSLRIWSLLKDLGLQSLSHRKYEVGGAPRIERDGSPVDLDTRKAIALVAYLAIEGQTIRRDSLAGLLARARQGSGTRGAAAHPFDAQERNGGEGDGDQADRATVGLTNDAVWTDATEFRRLIEQSQVPLSEGDPDACLTLAGASLRWW